MFEDVDVTAHNLRSDVLGEGVITAMDVILSLGDQDEITYELKWYESIGTARLVKNYWVEAIDGARAMRFRLRGWAFEVQGCRR